MVGLRQPYQKSAASSSSTGFFTVVVAVFNRLYSIDNKYISAKFAFLIRIKARNKGISNDKRPFAGV
jgi:hypothetical protein